MRQNAKHLGKTIVGLVLVSQEIFKIFFVRGWTKELSFGEN